MSEIPSLTEPIKVTPGMYIRKTANTILSLMSMMRIKELISAIVTGLILTAGF